MLLRPQRGKQASTNASSAAPLVSIRAMPNSNTIAVGHPRTGKSPPALETEFILRNTRFHQVCSFIWDSSTDEYNFPPEGSKVDFPAVSPLKAGDKLMKFEQHRLEEVERKSRKADPERHVSIEKAWKKARSLPHLRPEILDLMKETKIVARRNCLVNLGSVESENEEEFNLYASSDPSNKQQKRRHDSRNDVLEIQRDDTEPLFIDRIGSWDDGSFLYPRDVLGQAFEIAATTPRELRDRINTGKEEFGPYPTISYQNIIIVEFPVDDDHTFKIGLVCEIDCQETLPDGRLVLSELKSTRDRPLEASWILKTWIQAFLGHIDGIWIGFRDLDPTSPENPKVNASRAEFNRFHQITKDMTRTSTDELYNMLPISDHKRRHSMQFLWKFLFEISRIDVAPLRQANKIGQFPFQIVGEEIVLSIK